MSALDQKESFMHQINDKSTKRLPSILLRRLRNHIRINDVITSILDIPHKHSDGRLRFLCPLCSEFQTAINPNTNLARCFRCQKNFNPIDMVIITNNYSFIEAVNFLKPFLS